MGNLFWRRFAAVLMIFGCGLVLTQTLHANTILCKRVYISGLKEPHDRALQILGDGIVMDPKLMSVYVTVVPRKGGQVLYLQSNYRPAGQYFPNKIGTSDEKELKYYLFKLGNFKTGAPFDLSGVTFYVEPAFYSDPKFGKYKDQLAGKVVALRPDSAPAKAIAPKAVLQPQIPTGWVGVSKGVVQTRGVQAPANILQLSKGANTKLIAYDPRGSKGGFANMVFEEDPGAAEGLELDDLTLDKIGQEYAKTCSCRIFERKILDFGTRKILRITYSRKLGKGKGEILSVIYFFKNGEDLDTVTGTCQSDYFKVCGAVFQDAFQRTLQGS